MRSPSLNPKEISKIFITHLHGDHIFGLAGVLLCINSTNLKVHDSPRPKPDEPKPLTQVYGPPGLYNYICAVLKVSQSGLQTDVEVIEMHGGTQEEGLTHRYRNCKEVLLKPIDVLSIPNVRRTVLYPDEDGVWALEEGEKGKKELLDKWTQQMVDERDGVDPLCELLPPMDPVSKDDLPFGMTKKDLNGNVRRGFRIEAAEVYHVRGVQTFGFVITETADLPRIDPLRCEAMGVKPGLKYELLKLGIRVFSDDKNQIINPEQVLKDEFLDHGRKLGYWGDCNTPSTGMVKISNDLDVLVHEATLGDEYKHRARVIGHSTPSMAAYRAIQSVRDGGLLCLNHFSNRYATQNMTEFVSGARKMLYQVSSCK